MKNNLLVFSVDTAVQWKWLGRLIRGHIKEIYTTPVSKMIKGKTIKRNGSIENPAYLVQSEAENYALKLGSELQKVEQSKVRTSKPNMFSA
jgi:hypothetical protein